MKWGVQAVEIKNVLTNPKCRCKVAAITSAASCEPGLES
jgi:hypothetical protein